MVNENRTSPDDHDALHAIVRGTVADTSEEFFDLLVMHISQAMGTRCAWVTEWVEYPLRMRALSFWVGDRYIRDYEYDITHTPCKNVIVEDRLVHIPDRVLEIYPNDPDLAPLGAVSYMGAPLHDTDGRILGHLALMDDAPMPEVPKKNTIFSIFAARAEAELRRIRRDRNLREREQKLSRLIDGAMDAIIELDGGLTILHMNKAALETFGIDREYTSKRFDAFVSRESFQKLKGLIDNLDGNRSKKQYLWIRDGIDARRADGREFPAEATLSRFEVDGKSFYTLILRNVNERIEAEQHIRSLMDEATTLRAELQSVHNITDMIGNSRPLRQVFSDVDRVAAHDTTVLITGETGTGKELVARAIHKQSSRAERALVKVNCAAIPANLQESEFFGHTKGAFTGATQARQGRFELAHGGTIFLDEIGELPLDLQAKLLRVLQEGEFEPVGADRTVKVDVRVIAATNRDLDNMVEIGEFRRDLLYRLNVFPIHVPPLRDRKDDILPLAERLAQTFAARTGRATPLITTTCRDLLRSYHWPGNVRELQNVIERAIITSVDGRTLNLGRAIPSVDSPRSPISAAKSPINDDRVLTAAEFAELETRNVQRALELADWKISGRGGAAELLDVNPNTLASRIKSLGIKRPTRP